MMTMREIYKSYHGYLRRALNAGARGYLDLDLVDKNSNSERSKRAQKAAIKSILANGRITNPVWNHTLFYIDTYRRRAIDRLDMPIVIYQHPPCAMLAKRPNA